MLWLFAACAALLRTTMIECPVDDFVPLVNTKLPSMVDYKQIRERAHAACNTALVLESEGYIDSPPDLDSLRNATADMLGGMVTPQGARSELLGDALSTPEGAYYVNSLLKQYDMEVVQDAKRLRNYVTNKLVVEAENLDARIRIKALELLGKISDVGLFTERTEITVNNRSTVELENSLRDKLKKLMGVDSAEDATIVAHPVEIQTPIDVAEALNGL